MKPIYYLSGKITDVTREKELFNMEVFNQTERDLTNRGFNVFNPATLEIDGGTWEWYLARDLKYIVENRPIIYLIDGNWRESKGAKLEVEFAKLLGLSVIDSM